jgi:agmatinase
MEAFYGFADANAEFKEAKYVIFYLPYDKTTTHRKGARKGPEAICKESWNFESWDLRRGHNLKSIKVHDWGAIKISNNEEPEQMVKEVYKIAKKIARAGKFPLLLGGEHTGSIGVIWALSELREDFGVIHFDAHLDYRKNYEGERFSHACVARRIAEQIGPERIVLLGIRSASEDEIEDAKKDELHYFTSWDVRAKGINEIVENALNLLNAKKIYLSFDMDGIDPAYAPGVSTPEPFGLTSLEGLALIEALAPYLIGFDLMEVCPSWDKGLTSCLAAKLIREVIMLNHGMQKG